MSIILKALPSALKTNLAKFKYKEAINMHPFLQDRDEDFYADYLDELQVDQYTKGEIVAKANTFAIEVFFIMNGVIKNTGNGKFFEACHMVNHEALLLNEKIKDDIVAETDVLVLKYDSETFKEILDKFPEVQDILKGLMNEKKKV